MLGNAPAERGGYSSNQRALAGKKALAKNRPRDVGSPTKVTVKLSRLIKVARSVEPPDLILETGKNNLSSRATERVFDERIYRHYGLTRVEIKLVEGDPKG